MARPAQATSGFVPINKAPPAAADAPPRGGQLQPLLVMPQSFPQPNQPPPDLPPHMQPKYPTLVKGEKMDIDDDNDSNATISERGEGVFDYSPNPETINLLPYYESINYLLSPPTGMAYPTSVEVATLITETPLQIKPVHDQSQVRSEHAFMERLFNFGGMLGKAGHTPMFSSSTGEYKFHTQRDRDLAAQHGFASEEQMLKYLDDLKGSGRRPTNESNCLRFSTPWHEIDLIFEPRKRGHVEPGTGTSRRKSAKSKTLDSPIEKEEEPVSSPNDGDTIMSNGDDDNTTTEVASPDTPSVSTLTLDTKPTIPGTSGTTAGPAAPLKPKKKYVLPKKIPIEPRLHPICAEDLIHAVTRHPLLLPAEPVTTDFIITHAPHLLQNVGLLYILAHGELENEGLSEKLGKLGLDVAPNVLAHRKKKALQDLGGEYKDRKVQYENYKKSLRRSPRKGRW